MVRRNLKPSFQISNIRLFPSFKAGRSYPFLYPTVQDTLVQLMLINIRDGSGLAKPWAFGMLGLEEGMVVRRVVGQMQ